MATRKMTFTIPEDIAAQFLKHVPAQDRSRFVSAAIAAKLQERESELIRACAIANNDPDIQSIEREWDTLPDDVEEPWTDPPSR